MAPSKKPSPQTSKNGTMKIKARGKAATRSIQERIDDEIMHTNDSSITSKRCVSKLYYPDEPDFYEPFCPKYVRRNPLINRGYWLRMHAVEQAVLQFLKQNTAKSKIIVNLGCGYDPLPFQFWHRHDALCNDAVFVDVDYPQLIGKKRDRMLLHDALRNALLRTNLRPSELPVFVRSDRYMALGCDLRNLGQMETLLQAEIDLARSSVLFVAEVSLTYMPVTDSDALLAWASTLEDARFCLLEQYLPQGPDHPFAQTMLRHFDKLQTPIHAVKLYPTLLQQVSRFEDAGWSTVEVARSLWDLWSDDNFTPPAVRHTLGTVEPFDEWEEFALFAGHYFMVVASTSDRKTPMKAVQIDQTNNGSMEGIDGTEGRPMKTSLAIAQYATAPSQMSLRRFGAAFTVGNEAVVHHGGQGLPSRLVSMDTLVRENTASIAQPCNSMRPPARMCHTVTPFNGHAALLVGGRASPACALADSWLFEHGGWKQVDDLCPARFRHNAVKVNICLNGTDTEGVLVFGGRTSNGTVLDEWKLWTPVSGWKNVSADSKQRPSARYGSAMSIFGLAEDSGFLVGGLDPSGVVLEDIWEWRIAAPSLQLEFKDRTNDIRMERATDGITYSRLGASLVPFDDVLLLIGGVSKHKIGGLREDFVVLAPDAKEGKISVYQPAVTLPASAWPLLVGASAVAVSNEVVIVGGGAVCFSMGSFWNRGYLTITANPTKAQHWVISTESPPTRSTRKIAEKPASPNHVKNKQPHKANRVTGAGPTAIPHVQLHSAEDFMELLHTGKPAIIEGQEIGPCQTLWTLSYLKDKVGAEREIIIHECETDRMTFKDKNFQYTKKPFGEFIEGVAAGSRTYLRAISSTQANKLPTKLEEDFPTIAPDFHLGPAFAYVQENLHSSPLRISGPVALWLHYDVLANILVQITGSKTLLLYPPSDVAHLSYPPGGSSSNIDVHSPSSSAALRNTHPYSAFLRPGDILFIPPMWSHTAKPSTGSSVAVNVFFRNLEQGYAAGKDVYGNRDLQAYENGRRDVDKIMRAFKGLPRDMAKFYVQRLAAELLERGEGLDG